jgi:hypothetical protein
LQGRRTWLQLLCVTLARTRCSSAAFPASCDAIRIGLPPPQAERFRSTLADALVQFSPDHRLRLAALHSPLLPSREPKPARTGAISISSASSPRCRLISSAAFPLMASDVLHARLYCPLGRFALNRRAAASLHPHARLQAAAGPELCSSVHVASHVPQLLHTRVSLFPCRSTPSRQYYAAPPPRSRAFAPSPAAVSLSCISTPVHIQRLGPLASAPAVPCPPPAPRPSRPRSTHRRAPSRATCSCPAPAPASACPRARAACQRPTHASSARLAASPPTSALRQPSPKSVLSHRHSPAVALAHAAAEPSRPALLGRASARRWPASARLLSPPPPPRSPPAPARVPRASARSPGPASPAHRRSPSAPHCRELLLPELKEGRGKAGVDKNGVRLVGKKIRAPGIREQWRRMNRFP